MKSVFGYIWFRISKVYRKEDKLGITGSGFLSFAQALLLLEIIVSILRSTYGSTFIQSYAKQFGYLTIVTMLALILLNHKLYSSMYDFFYNHWKMETKLESFLKGCLVLLFILLPIVIGIMNIDLVV